MTDIKRGKNVKPYINISISKLIKHAIIYIESLSKAGVIK